MCGSGEIKVKRFATGSTGRRFPVASSDSDVQRTLVHIYFISLLGVRKSVVNSKLNASALILIGFRNPFPRLPLTGAPVDASASRPLGGRRIFTVGLSCVFGSFPTSARNERYSFVLGLASVKCTLAHYITQHDFLLRTTTQFSARKMPPKGISIQTSRTHAPPVMMMLLPIRPNDPAVRCMWNGDIKVMCFLAFLFPSLPFHALFPTPKIHPYRLRPDTGQEYKFVDLLPET